MKTANRIKTILLAASLLLAGAVYAEGNPHRASYGTWQGKGVDKFVIGKHGFEEFAKVKASCRNKQQGYVHEASWISGKQLAKDIRDSINADDGLSTPQENKQYAQSLQKSLKLIQPQKKYLRIVVALSCADGATSFVQLSPNEGLHSLSAPDEYFTPVRRVK